jgi:hypothetical protein
MILAALHASNDVARQFGLGVAEPAPGHAWLWGLVGAFLMMVFVVDARRKNLRAKKTWHEMWDAFAR